MSKFFVDKKNILAKSINITGEDVIHIKKVLRLKCGDNIIISDGAGTDYYVEIQNIQQDLVETKIISFEKNIAEPSINITLFQGLPKSDKMDLIIQKGVELGVKKIVPVITERTVVKISGAKDSIKKCERWNRISMEASKQCNRGFIPKVDGPIFFSDALKMLNGGNLNILPYEKEKDNRLKYILNDSIKAKDIYVFIGPEGGFSQEEVEIAVKSGVNTVSLGPRILRTETAGIAVLSILMYELGDVGNG
ncbi:UNVERIFIED_CONTAM: 16S rRNA (uracil1498-N3)-methyltransferase [Acetivibrio alkalicellulosi]